MDRGVPYYKGTYFNSLPYEVAHIIFNYAPLSRCSLCCRHHHKKKKKYLPQHVHCSVVVDCTFDVAVCIRHEHKLNREKQEEWWRSLHIQWRERP